MLLLRSAFTVLPFLWREAPGSPLRVLGMAWACYVTGCHGQRLSRATRSQIANFLRLHAELNAFLDAKRRGSCSLRRCWRSAEAAGILPDFIRCHAREIFDIEQARPLPGLLQRTRYCRAVRSYREAALILVHRRLMLLSAPHMNVDARIERMMVCVMGICQFIDDQIDAEEDIMRGLPSYRFAAYASGSREERYRRLLFRRYLKDGPLALMRYVFGLQQGCGLQSKRHIS